MFVSLNAWKAEFKVTWSKRMLININYMAVQPHAYKRKRNKDDFRMGCLLLSLPDLLKGFLKHYFLFKLARDLFLSCRYILFIRKAFTCLHLNYFKRQKGVAIITCKIKKRMV